jgi:hypothetical protein
LPFGSPGSGTKRRVTECAAQPAGSGKAFAGVEDTRTDPGGVMSAWRDGGAGAAVARLGLEPPVGSSM